MFLYASFLHRHDWSMAPAVTATLALPRGGEDVRVIRMEPNSRSLVISLPALERLPRGAIPTFELSTPGGDTVELPMQGAFTPYAVFSLENGKTLHIGRYMLRAFPSPVSAHFSPLQWDFELQMDTEDR
jgi:hypothetical protein